MNAAEVLVVAGSVLILLAAMAGLHDMNSITFLVLGGALQVLTAPVGSNLLARATYRAEGIPHQVDTIDELADLLHPDGEHPDAGPPHTGPP